MPNLDPEAVAKVADGLTEAQIAFLFFLPEDGSWAFTQERDFNRHGPNALRGFGQSGLFDGEYRNRMRHRLTPFGMTVRNHINKGKTDV